MRGNIMLEHIKHIKDEAEARRLLMKLGNGPVQVEQYIAEWKQLFVVKQKVVTATSTETEVAPRVSAKITKK
jgi:hypothetical protein